VKFTKLTPTNFNNGGMGCRKRGVITSKTICIETDENKVVSTTGNEE